VNEKPKIGVSACLLGQPFRHNGDPAEDQFLTNTLSKYVDWVSVCPEVEAGLGTPREPMELIGTPLNPTIISKQTRTNHTKTLKTYTDEKLNSRELESLSGYVFKTKSITCGINHIPITQENGSIESIGMGVFSRAFKSKYPLIPVTDERDLHNRALRLHFFEQVFCYYRWKKLMHSRVTKGSIVGFHTRHKYLLMAYSPKHYQSLGQLVAKSQDYDATALAYEYGEELMAAVREKPTPRKHANVLYHMVGHLTECLEKDERTDLHDIITQFHRGAIPLQEPIQRIRHYARTFHVDYLCTQAYLNPYPDALMK